MTTPEHSPDSVPDHIRKPHLRPIQPIPMVQDGKALIVLRDPTMLAEQTMAVPQQMMGIIQRFSGEETIDDIAAGTGLGIAQLLQLIENLDRLGLIWGPTFTELESDLKHRIENDGYFPRGSSASLGEDVDACRARLDALFDAVEDPELDGEIVGIVAPHLDYDRGGENYASAYYALRSIPKPDRVVVLGTNHFGIGDGVVLAPYGFETPFGVCPADRTVVDRLIEKHGKAITADQLDHMGEHSVELHLPWIQYCFGNDIPVVAALIPSPLADMIDDDDDDRTDTPTFIASLREILDDVGGTTIYVASSDLSHVGPQFGEPRPVDNQRRNDVERHDREMLVKFIARDTEAFVEAFKWNRNPTRWCSIGNMAATLQLADPGAIELIEYQQASDDAGNVMVSSAALVLMR